jgi:hypothetical protein
MPHSEQLQTLDIGQILEALKARKISTSSVTEELLTISGQQKPVATSSTPQ